MLPNTIGCAGQYQAASHLRLTYDLREEIRPYVVCIGSNLSEGRLCLS